MANLPEWTFWLLPVDLFLAPIGCLYTVISLVRSFPVRRDRLVKSGLFIVYLNVAGRVVPYSPSMYALFLLGFPLAKLIDSKLGTPNSTIEPETIQWWGTIASIVLFLLFIGIGSGLAAIRHVRKRQNPGSAPS